jgi:acetyltransferase EpsM
MTPNMIVIGAGAHGRVVIAAIIAAGAYNIVGVADDSAQMGTLVSGDICVVGRPDDIDGLTAMATHFIVAIGSNQRRSSLFASLASSLEPGTVVHPRAWIEPSARLDPGSVVLAAAVVNCGVTIGVNSIVNLGVIVDHDATIGDHVHLRPGTIVRSYAEVQPFFVSEPAAVI